MDSLNYRSPQRKLGFSPRAVAREKSLLNSWPSVPAFAGTNG
jgi:hypothetical protein